MINSVAHPSMVAALNASVQLQLVEDEMLLPDQDDAAIQRLIAERNRVTAEVDSSLISLRSWAIFLMRYQAQNLPIMPMSDQPAMQGFRQQSARLQKWLMSHPDMNMANYPKYGDVLNALRAVPLRSLAVDEHGAFPAGYVVRLGGWLIRQTALFDVQERGNWLAVSINPKLKEIKVTNCQIDSSNQTASADVIVKMNKDYDRVRLLGSLKGQAGSEIGAGEADALDVKAGQEVTVPIRYYYTGDPVPGSCSVYVAFAE
jgi:hypothetical protein